jgi:hypothetical protein
MRTAIDIDDDVLSAAKERARRERRTAGEVASDLLRQALTSSPAVSAIREAPPVYGLRPFSPSGAVVTNELINQLRNDDET